MSREHGHGIIYWIIIGDSDASIGDDDDDDEDENVGTNICRTNSVWPAENVHI